MRARYASARAHTHRATTVLLVTVLAAGTGCRDSETRATDGAEARAEAPAGTSVPQPSHGNDARVDSAVPAASDTSGQRSVDSLIAAIQACPRDGLWHRCSVERRLQMAGLRPVSSDTLSPIPSLRGEPLAWQLGRQSLRAHLYRSEREAVQAFAVLDSATAAPKGDLTVLWPDRPTLLRSANGVFLYLGGSDRQVIRVSDAIMAGPPQPER